MHFATVTDFGLLRTLAVWFRHLPPVRVSSQDTPKACSQRTKTRRRFAEASTASSIAPAKPHPRG